MLTDAQIVELAGKMGIPLESVSFKDELPGKLKFNRAYVVNLENEYDAEGLPNQGSHWTCFEIVKDNDGKIQPIYFDSFGVGPPLAVSDAVFAFCGRKLPHCEKDIQSIMSSCCGWFCLAFLHWINSSQFRSGHCYADTASFLAMFDDLGVVVSHLKNEFILKHFFRSSDTAKRIPVELTNAITNS